MKIRIELNLAMVDKFFQDATLSEPFVMEGNIPLRVNGLDIEDFFHIRIDIANHTVDATCINVFERLIGYERYEDNTLIDRMMIVDLSDDEKNLFLAGYLAYRAGEGREAERIKSRIDTYDGTDKN